ncbi:MAG: Hsp70 family protein [Deltaproteobacteria bacterium]|nr:MAG: Hsp70 family protein [Deltaproteobacteria bacterium]
MTRVTGSFATLGLGLVHTFQGTDTAVRRICNGRGWPPLDPKARLCHNRPVANERPVLGIDFGTTNTAAAWCDAQGKIHLVPVGEKSYTLPSVVWFGPGEKVLVGALAREQLLDDPHRTVVAPKRFIGRRFKSEFVTRNKDRYPYEIIEDEQGLCAAAIEGSPVSFTDVAFHVIRRILELANATAGFEFEDAVLTVPAHFSYGQRRGVRTAAEMAGLEVRAMVNEPTAAALYYAKHKDAGGRVLVFDLGGGTFDATLLDVSRRVATVLSTGGDPYLGGRDFDSTIVTHLLNVVTFEQGRKLDPSKVVMQRLLFAAEAAKIRLTKEEVAHIKVPLVASDGTGFVDLEYDLTRAELEEISEGLIARAVGIVGDVLAAAGCSDLDVGEVIFVGGQTRMPAIRDRLTRRFKHDPKKHVHPELGVAIGAAILGRTLNLPRGPALVDVVPMPIGVMAPTLGTKEVIGRNAVVPSTHTVTIETRPPDGQPMNLAVYEAADAAAVERELLGMLTVPADWMAAHAGDLTLEMRIGFDFDLTCAIVSPHGSKQLPLQPV